MAAADDPPTLRRAEASTAANQTRAPGDRAWSPPSDTARRRSDFAEDPVTIGPTQESDLLRVREEGSDATFRVESTAARSSAVRSRARPRRLVLAPVGRRGWDCDDVAAHLLDRRAALIGSLARRSPWGGIDRETLDGLYVEAAAKVARIAGSQQRRDWRTRRDLERAMIAAFRFEAQHYWRNVKAEKRRGDRAPVPFDPDEHAEGEDLLARIFDASPHEELVARDWLAQLRGEVRAFWALLLEGVSFTHAGERLGLPYRECQALYRAGLEQLGRFRALQESGKVCQLRAPAIAALRAGTADDLTAERARAHLACCLSCALVHERNASALRRGILHVLPLPAVVRALARVRDLVGDRAAEAATAGGATGVGGAFLLGNGTTTALLCAGALAGGACVVGVGPLPSPLHTHHAHHAARRLASTATRSVPATATTLSAPPLPNTLVAASPTPRPSTPAKAPHARTSEFGTPPPARQKSSGTATPTSAQAAEFSPENAGTASTSSSSRSPTASTASTRPASTSSSTSSTTTSRSSSTPTSSSEFGGP